ncbi:hypothetical protein KAJ27_09145, partial [bacterium]|nr:hypothetical protein [bacterium]
IKEANEKNKLVKKSIDLILKKIIESKRFKIKALVECKDDYYLKLKGVKKYDFVQVNFSIKDHEKSAELKVKVPEKALSEKSIDEGLKAKLFKEYSNNVQVINSKFKKKIKKLLKNIDVLNRKIEANYDRAYSVMFMSSKESRNKINLIHNEIEEIIANIAKEKNLYAVFNNSLSYTELLTKVNSDSPQSISDIHKQAEKIEEEYNSMMLHLKESGVLSKKSLLTRKKLLADHNDSDTANQIKEVQLMDEQAYLISYDGWLTEMDDWFSNNVEKFKTLDSNSKFILGGGKDITMEVLELLFDKYNLKSDLQDDIFEYIKEKNK